MNLGSLARILQSPLLYLIWQGPFVKQKIRPVLRDIDGSKSMRILDIGCGPGTNAAIFAERHDYVGVDLSAEYVEFAARKHKRPFFVCDVVKDPLPVGPFDIVLMNSLMHHLSDDQVDVLLNKVLAVLAPGGTVQIVDLLLPEEPSMARFLATHDRGEFPRPLEQWRTLFSRHFRLERFEPFSVGLFWIPLWRLVYVKGAK